MLTSESARPRALTLPLKPVVPAYQKGVEDVGADTAPLDALGDTWTQDRPYAEGSFGYVRDTRSWASPSRPV